MAARVDSDQYTKPFLLTRTGASGIVITGRRQHLLEKVSQEIAVLNGKVQVLTFKADAAVEKDVENLYAEIQKAFGRHADVLLNNAGYTDDGKLVGEQNAENWWKGFISCSLLSLLYATLQHLDV